MSQYQIEGSSVDTFIEKNVVNIAYEITTTQESPKILANTSLKSSAVSIPRNSKLELASKQTAIDEIDEKTTTTQRSRVSSVKSRSQTVSIVSTREMTLQRANINVPLQVSIVKKGKRSRSRGGLKNSAMSSTSTSGLGKTLRRSSQSASRRSLDRSGTLKRADVIQKQAESQEATASTQVAMWGINTAN